MAEGLSDVYASGILNALGNGTPLAVTTLYAQLHVGPPGGSGVANPAADTRRIAISFGQAIGSVITNDVAVTWSNVVGAQDPTHWSAWDAAAGGTFVFSGIFNSVPYAAGNTLTVPPGSLAVSFSVAS